MLQKAAMQLRNRQVKPALNTARQVAASTRTSALNQLSRLSTRRR